MTEPSESDDPATLARWAALQRANCNEWCCAPEEEVLANMNSTGLAPAQIHCIKGRVEDTLPGHAPKTVALLRLDTDWFESTYHEMVTLFDRVSVGGVIAIDDYGHHVGARSAVDKFLAERGESMLLTRLDSSGCSP